MRQNLVIVLFGLAAIGLGVYEFYDLAAMEVEGGTRRVHSLIKLVYEAGGKFAVLGVLGGVGAVMTIFGGVKMLKKPRNEQAA
jgi:hypothetical protein